MDEHGCAGCDTKAKIIRNLVAVVEEYCETHCELAKHGPFNPPQCSACHLSKRILLATVMGLDILPTKPSREHIDQVKDGTLPEPPAATQAEIINGIGRP